MSSTNPSNSVEEFCFHCNLKRKRIESNGVFYHTYNENNWQDNDHYTEVCSVQTPAGVEILRADALIRLNNNLHSAELKVADLKKLIKQVKKANRVGLILASAKDR